MARTSGGSAVDTYAVVGISGGTAVDTYVVAGISGGNAVDIHMRWLGSQEALL